MQKKIQEYNRAKERRAEEKALRERKERINRAQEAHKRAAEETAHPGDAEEDFDFSGPGGPGGFDQFGQLLGEIMSDPEIKEAIQKDPSIISALTEMMSNPASIMKHMSNPILMKIMSKLGSKFGGGGAPGFAFGEGAGSANPTEDTDHSSEPSTAPKKAPEPDLD